MKESIISQKLVEYNKTFLKLYYSKEVQSKIRRETNFSYVKTILYYLKNRRILEFVSRIIKRAGNTVSIKRPVGTLYKETKDQDYSMSKSVVIYSAVFGNRTEIHEPLYVNSNYKYVMFTDHKLNDNSSWSYCPLPKEMPSFSNGAEINRWLKLHPHILFPDFDVSVYIDGNITLVSDVMPYAESLGTAFFATHILAAPIDSVYESAKAVIAAKKAPKEVVEQQMLYYKNEGFPFHWGMYENGFLIREHNDPRCIQLMDDWWNEMVSFSKRDQLSLSFVVWRNKLSNSDILLLGDNIYRNPRLSFII